MNHRMLLLSAGLGLAVVFGSQGGRDGALPRTHAQVKNAGTKTERAADRAAIQKSSQDFAKAFEKGDAKAVAALWTEQGEYHDDMGTSLVGRAAIEDAYRAHFKEKAGGKIGVLIESIRFPAADLAVEQGILRQTGDGKEMPTTSLYTVLHVRDQGQWKIAISREWGRGQDRLEDLEWLVGTWSAKVQDQEVTLCVAKDKNKAFLAGSFTRKAKDKTESTGTMKIALDPQTGRIRSWHFDDDGGHGQALWVRDGQRWVLDAVGVLADGTETGGVNILGRVSQDEITWRSIDRVAGDVELPDTVPVKLTRVRGAK